MDESSKTGSADIGADTPPNPTSSGGPGGNAAHPSRSDCRLTERAARQRWITPEQQQQIADAMIALATDRSQGRTAVSAGRVVAAFDRIDFDREKLESILNPPPEPEPQNRPEPDARDLLETMDAYNVRKARLLDQWRQETDQDNDQAETAMTGSSTRNES